jgi:hypothetical protein
MTDIDFPTVLFGPTDPIESARSCVMKEIIAHRGDHGKNLVRDYCRMLDEHQHKFEISGYTPEQVAAVRQIFTTAKATAIRDGRVFAYLWF